MKILYLCRSLNMGGLEKNLLLLTPHLREHGCEVHVAAASGVMRQALVDAGAVYHELSCDLRSPLRIGRDVSALCGLVRREAPDVIHVFSAATGALMALARWRLRASEVPVQVASVMGLQESADESPWRTHLRNYLTVVGASRRFIISPVIGRYLRALPLKESTLADVPVVGIEIPALPDATLRDELRQAVRDEFNIPREHALVTTIGYLGGRKSHDLFIDAASIVARDHTAVSFIIVGDGPDRNALQARIDSNGLADRIRLVGLRRDLERILPATDVCIKPGIIEGFIGITVLEAQALEVPVIAFDTVDVRMAIADGETGLIAARGDVYALAQAIGRLLADPALARALARSGREAVVRRFGIGDIARQLVEAYSREIKTARPDPQSNDAEGSAYGRT